MRAAFCLTLGAVFLAGCAGGAYPPRNPDHPRAESMLNRETPRATRFDASATLRDGIRLYANGDFAGAIATLDAPAFDNASVAIRTSALKYTAFSYCVTQRPVPCRQAFDKALRLDARFALAPGEEGHPMWSPVYDKARASR